jgi:hypothetical protein
VDEGRPQAVAREVVSARIGQRERGPSEGPLKVRNGPLADRFYNVRHGPEAAHCRSELMVSPQGGELAVKPVCVVREGRGRGVSAAVWIHPASIGQGAGAQLGRSPGGVDAFKAIAKRRLEA